MAYPHSQKLIFFVHIYFPKYKIFIRIKFPYYIELLVLKITFRKS